MGVILGSGVIPIALCITWKKANKWCCISGSLIGFAAGLIAWLITTAKLNNNVINVVVSRLYTALPIEFLIWHKTSGGDFEMLAGNIASFIIGGLIAFISSVVVWHISFFINAQVVLNEFLSGPKILIGALHANSTRQYIQSRYRRTLTKPRRTRVAKRTWILQWSRLLYPLSIKLRTKNLIQLLSTRHFYSHPLLR